MRGFEEERETVRAVVESLDLTPVMAESFGARSQTPEEACLEGVAQSDCFLGILGQRYGFVTSAGTSVTEQEFNEAQRLGLPILLVFYEGDKEPQQEDFASRVGGYESGYFMGKYKTIAQLGPVVAKALNNHLKRSHTAGKGRAAARIKSLLKAEDRTSDTFLVVVSVPVDSREYVDVTSLGQKSFHDALLQPTFVGEGALFRYDLATETEDGREHIGFIQRERDREGASRIEVHTDGAILVSTSLREIDEHSRSMFSTFDSVLIDERFTAERIAAACRYIAVAYGGPFIQPGPSRSLVQAAIRNAENKLFGLKPTEQVRSFSYPMAGVEHDVVVPAEPYVATRAELAQPDALVTKLTTLLGRAFRAAGAYYEPGRRSR